MTGNSRVSINRNYFLPKNDDIKMCPVCGYPAFEAFDQNGLTTFEICPCCRCQAGYHYVESHSIDRFVELRRKWITDDGANWQSENESPPKGWSAARQLRLAGFDN